MNTNTKRAITALLVLAASCLAPAPAQAQEGRKLVRRDWRTDPRSAVLGVLGLVVVVGGGRRLLYSLRARRAVELLQDDQVTPDQIRAVATFSREGLMDLFRLLTTATDPAQRDAAGQALTTLWARDQLVAEEEKAIVARGFQVDWLARRRYPRGMQAPFPVVVRFGLPFLREEGTGVRPDQLEWSYRITGSQRAALEAQSEWSPGPMRVTIPIDPSDFPTNGPHRLVLKARARTRGLTSLWELELPHIPFTFEFDPILQLEALLTLPDQPRSDLLARAVSLDVRDGDNDVDAQLLPIGPDLVLRGPPALLVRTPLPCDLSHQLFIDFEGHEGRLAAGQVVLSGQGTDAATGSARFALSAPARWDAPLPDRPGPYRIRIHLEPNAELGWSNPDVRSIWPGSLTTDWHPVKLIRP